MMDLVRWFSHDESGAVTVDWVILTAACVGLALMVGTTLTTQIGNVADDISEDMVSTINGDGGIDYTE